MSRRIEGGLGSQLNPFGPQWPTSKDASQIPSVGEQVQRALFNRPQPLVLDPAKFPMLAEQMRLLNRFKKKLAQLAGDEDEDYTINLADGPIAQIDEHGNIFMGAQFLFAAKNNPELMVGVLAHEIGHRPRRWKDYKVRKDLTKEQLEALCRHEETRADLFSGRALAELDMSAEPLAQFLLNQPDVATPHPEYFPAEVRAQVIRDAHMSRGYALESRKKLFPDYERMHSPKGHIGEF